MSPTKHLITPTNSPSKVNALKKLKLNHVNTDDDKTAIATKEDNYDYLFNNDDDDFDMFLLEELPNDFNKAHLDLSNWQRCKVDAIERNKKTYALILKVSARKFLGIANGDASNRIEQILHSECHLQGPWSFTKVAVNDIVSLKAVWDDNLNAYKMDKDEGFCVTDPDNLISGTTVVSSLFCRRKAVLQDRFRGIDVNNRIMVIGSLVHELLQTVLENQFRTLDEINLAAVNLLKCQNTAYMLYSSQLTLDDVRTEVMHFVPNIYDFICQNINLNQQANMRTNGSDVVENQIADIEDIEENLWIPQLGLKGKIDVCVQVRSHQSKGAKKKVLPLELKTGNASFSLEHKGQLILYEMMLTASGRPTESGLLLYLRENIMREISGSRNEQRDLISLRNELNYYLSSIVSNRNMIENLQVSENKFHQPFELPEPISHPTACRKCPYLTLCSSFVHIDPELKLSSQHELNKLIPETIAHLTASDFAYFIKWCHLLMLEEKELRKSNNLSNLWTQTPYERTSLGTTLCNLQISPEIKLDDSRFIHYFSPSKDRKNKDTLLMTDEKDLKDLRLSSMNVGDYVTVSTTQCLAIAMGAIVSLTSSEIAIRLDRNLLKKYSGECFIIDKYEFQGAGSFNFTNLSLLLDNTERSKELREIVIQCKLPTFHKVLPKIIATKGCEILKQLNSIQRSAVLNALTTQNFMLIKGLPGTGKTQCLVAIVRLLHLIGKTVLITSHTHSAVDNLLLRLNNYKIPFLRLASTSSRVNPLLDNFTETALTSNRQTYNELTEIYNAYNIVGVTCLGSTHPIFLHRRFDYCIVDEATQILQPTVLRTLYFCDRFILVGDPDQLPPVVRSTDARQHGAEESLFHRLDNEYATSRLTLQYRMNQTITKLANDLTYKGALICANNEIKLASLKLPIPKTIAKEKWLQRTLQNHVDQAVFFLDTKDCLKRSMDFMQICKTSTQNTVQNVIPSDLVCEVDGSDITSSKSYTISENTKLSKYMNYCEAAVIFYIIKTLLEVGYDPDSIGLIAPYRIQVDLLRSLCQKYHQHYDANKLNFSQIEVNTIDQYQGRDKDIIVYSCSRTGIIKSADGEHRSSDVEILEDNRRLTVAISRSKLKLILVGDATCIQQYTPFRNLLSHIPSICKLQLENDKFDFDWQTLLDQLMHVIKN